MVNQKFAKNIYSEISIKGRVLAILREEPDLFFSGEYLAKRLGVSRVAVWKAVKSLQTANYPLLAGEKGYCWKLETTPPYNDFLYPWEFGEKEAFFHYVETTDSTMNLAMEFAIRGYPEGTVITAGEQTAGRGRCGRAWVSSKGGLFFTLLQRPAMCAMDYFRVAMGFQIAAARALKQLCGKQIHLHWPNDLYVEGKKIAGFLTEFHAEGDQLIWISLGLGVNVNNTLYAQEHSSKGNFFKEPINCLSFVSNPISRREVLVAILKQWEVIKKEIDSPELHKEWNSLVWGKGENVVAIEAADVLSRGIFMGIDEQGRAIIKTETGKRVFYCPGNVSIKEIQVLA